MLAQACTFTYGANQPLRRRKLHASLLAGRHRSAYPHTCRRYAQKLLATSDKRVGVSTSDPDVRTQPSASDFDLADDPKFQWQKNWYPCHVIDGLDPTRPTRYSLLGIDMVFWKDGSGEWKALEDKCSHRLAPLSQGRVEEDGTLLCAYHAWRFDGDGQCVSIPQADSQEKACASPRACVKSFPTRYDDGLLWVWPEAGADGLLASLLKEPPRMPELVLQDQPEEEREYNVVQFPWGLRDLPYGWEAFMENVTDPAHVPVSHHNITGNRYTQAVPVTMPVHRALNDLEGFEIGEFSFKPPCLMRIELSDRGSQNQTYLALFNVPTTPGHSRLIGCNVMVSPKSSKGGSTGFGMFTLPMPKWALHILGSLFLHQDLVLLHHQEKILAREDKKWLNACYMPTIADRATINFRRWLERNGEVDVHGKYAVPWKSISGVSSALPAREHDPDRLFDVYNAHVKHCTHCQGALRNFKWLRLASAAAAIAFGLKAVLISAISANVPDAISAAAPTAASVSTSLLARALSFLSSIVPLSPLKCFSLSLLFTLVAVGIHKFISLFYVYKFHHQDNN